MKMKAFAVFMVVKFAMSVIGVEGVPTMPPEEKVETGMEMVVGGSANGKESNGSDESK